MPSYKASETPKKLRDRIKPSEILEKEIKAQLRAQNLYRDDDPPVINLSSSIKSQLETFLWRDIEYFAGQDYVDQETINRSLRRLREKSLFIDTINELVERLSATSS